MNAKRYKQYEIAAQFSDTGEKMVLATDYDALLALARRLRKGIVTTDDITLLVESAWLDEA